MTTLTHKEFNELYGDVEVEFTSYYKYSFSFRGKTPDGNTVVVSIGGSSDDIYKLDVEAGEKVKVRDMYPSYAAVYPGDDLDYDKRIHEYSDW